MDGEKTLMQVKTEPEDIVDNHLIIDEDGTDDESEPPIKRAKIEKVTPECLSVFDPNMPLHHILVCEFCRNCKAAGILEQLLFGSAPTSTESPMHILLLWALRALADLKRNGRANETLQRMGIITADPRNVNVILQSAIDMSVIHMETIQIPVPNLVGILKYVITKKSIPELRKSVENRLHKLALTVENCALVYALCGEMLPAAKPTALNTFKLHMENNYVKLKCDKCGCRLYRDPQKCSRSNCPYWLENTRAHDTCFLKHVNAGKLIVDPHYVDTEKCTGKVVIVPRRVITEGVPDSVIAEMFKLYQG